MSSYGINLRLARTSNKITLEELAAESKVSSVAISCYERGVYEPMPSKAIKIARAMEKLCHQE